MFYIASDDPGKEMKSKKIETFYMSVFMSL